MQSLLSQALSAAAGRVDHCLRLTLDQLPHQSSALLQAMKYGLFSGGKRIRPYIVYCTGELFNTPLSRLDPAASAIECTHASSLILDDLPAMDDDIWRRGSASCHAKYGESTAILAGNSLQMVAFQLLTHPALYQTGGLDMRIKLVEELALASGIQGLCFGQSLDLQAHSAEKHHASHYQSLYHYKTSCLFRAAVRFGIYASGISHTPYQLPLECFAEKFGIAYQFHNDLVDFIGTPAQLGKPLGNDQRHHRQAYPATMTLEGAYTTLNRYCREARECLDALPGGSGKLAALLSLLNLPKHSVASCASGTPIP